MTKSNTLLKWPGLGRVLKYQKVKNSPRLYYFEKFNPTAIITLKSRNLYQNKVKLSMSKDKNKKKRKKFEKSRFNHSNQK